MATALVHRGPDDGGVWHDQQSGVALASRRLAILDLSPQGHQPMKSPCGRWVLVHNGEIYNFLELRRELEARGLSFRGGSDTEVIAAAVGVWGVRKTLERLNGMFATALWDRDRRELTLLRDRMGQKPLYYGWLRDGVLGFASELKAFRAVAGCRPAIERRVLPLLLRRACIPAPWTIYRGVWKLRPGHLLRVRAEDLRTGADLGSDSEPYWSLVQTLERGAAERIQDPAAAEEELEGLLGDAVGQCMVSDVEVGALLSGGVDSSTVVALMTKRATGPVRTFSVGFASSLFDEAPFAARVASHLGTEHTELYVSEEDALAVIPRLPAVYDEPFADSSQIPTLLVSSLAKRHVTVALTGDGADELFGGYSKYRMLERLAGLVEAPRPVRGLAGFIARRLPWPTASNWARCGAIGRRLANVELRERAAKLAALLAESRDTDALIVRVLSLWNDPATMVPGVEEPASAVTDPSRWPRIEGVRRRAMAADSLLYLPDDVLAKVDRASMAVSLETRIPLLDHRVVEFAARLPLPLVTGKKVLRSVLHRHVPEALVRRPKMGFSIPLNAWLRGALREWASDLLTSDRLVQGGYFTPEPVVERWSRHLARESDEAAYLWPILMFEAWRDAVGVR